MVNILNQASNAFGLKGITMGVMKVLSSSEWSIYRVIIDTSMSKINW